MGVSGTLESQVGGGPSRQAGSLDGTCCVDGACVTPSLVWWRWVPDGRTQPRSAWVPGWAGAAPELLGQPPPTAAASVWASFSRLCVPAQLRAGATRASRAGLQYRAWPGEVLWEGPAALPGGRFRLWVSH